MENLVVILVIAAILVFVIRYMVKAKQRGAKCIGCPDGATCSGQCAGCNGACGK